MEKPWISEESREFASADNPVEKLSIAGGYAVEERRKSGLGVTPDTTMEVAEKANTYALSCVFDFVHHKILWSPLDTFSPQA